MGFLDSLRHAFSVGPAEPPQPTAAQRELIERLCDEVVKRHLTTPAILFLESVRPLNYLSAQSLTFFAPLLTALGGEAACAELAKFLEHRGAIDYVCRRMEECEVARRTPGNPGPRESSRDREPAA